MTSTQAPAEYQPFEAGAKVKVKGALVGRHTVSGNAIVTDFRYYNGPGGTPEGDRSGGWYTVELTAGSYKGRHVNVDEKRIFERSAKVARAPRAKVEKPTGPLPKIIAYVGISDSGEYGNAACPHCGALGRYVHTFIVEGGQRRGAMAGCIKLYPISPVAEEHGKIIERAKDREAKGQKLASWDEAKLAAIDLFVAGDATEADTLEVIRAQNAKRSAWMDRRNGRTR